MRKTISVLLTLAMIFTMVIGGTGLTFAASGSTEATTMKIAGTDGTVTITTDKGKDIAAKVDTKLLNGYTIKTAAASYCFISLDDSKAIKLGQNTKVKVEKSNKKIELSLKSGEIFFDVDKKLSGNESMNIKTGNMTTGIRGTSGVAKILDQIAKLQLFSGSTQSKAVGLAGTSTTLNIAAGQELNASFTDLNAGTNPSQPTQPAEGTQPGQQVQTETAADGVSISTNPIAMDNFAVRSIIETSAIKSGVSATQALAAKAEEIIEKAADLLQKLDITQEAKNQIEKVTAEPEKLDTAKANAEAQAAIEQTLNEQTIETAQQEAAKVEGTTTDTTESKVLENVEVKNEAGANASALSLSEDGTSTTSDTPAEQPSTSGRSNSSGGGANGSQQESWISGCNATYNGEAHSIASLNETQNTDYYFWFFTDQEVQSSFLNEWSNRTPLATLDEDIASFQQFDGFYNGGGMPTICNVEDSKTYYYVAIPKMSDGELKSGSFEAKIEPVEVTVKWFLSDIRSGIEFGSKAQIAVNTTSAAVSNRPVAVAGIVGEDGSFKQVTCMASYLGGQRDAELAPVYERETGEEFNKVYNATISGLAVYYDHTNQEVESSPLKLSNYKLKSTPSLSFSYSYILDRSVSSEFFDESNRANWTDKTNYDVAFVKNETNGNYAQYRYSDGQLQDSGTATIDEILAILGDPESQYVSVYIDTGSDGQLIEDSGLPEQLSVVAGACTRAVYIKGAGIFDDEASHSISFRSEGAKNLLVQLGDGEDTRYTFMEASELSIGQRVEFNNTNGHIIADNVRIEGYLFNKNSSVLALSETATGSICVIGNGQSPTGILYLNDESVIEDDRVYTFASDGSASSQIEPMLVVSKKGDVRITSGTLRHYVNTTAYTFLHEGPGNGAAPTDEQFYTLLENVKDAMFGTNYINSVRYTIRSKNQEGTEYDNRGLKCTYAGSEVNGRIGGSILNGSSAVEESQNYFWITTSNFLYDNDSPYMEFKFPTSVFSETEYH